MSNLKTRLIESPAEPVKADVWKNIYFLTTGESDCGDKLFFSHDSALDAATGLLALCRKCVSGQIEWRGGFVSIKLLSHSIQIPAKP